ncbi:MAG: hypothetical protein A4E42_00409 [Methanoregulaceae archaeon PtaU1.Bin222]|nr:MAG: hypothetical protein A4E42_00409 [Methanoregulaceae archaeon PtaU1.Bin222]
MCRIAGSPHNDNAFDSYDTRRELSLCFPPAAKKVATRMTG